MRLPAMSDFPAICDRFHPIYRKSLDASQFQIEDPKEKEKILIKIYSIFTQSEPQW